MSLSVLASVNEISRSLVDPPELIEVPDSSGTLAESIVTVGAVLSTVQCDGYWTGTS